MSAWPWIAGAEAIAATGAAVLAILRAESWKDSNMRWRREACRLGNLLAQEREAKLFHFNLYRGDPHRIGAPETKPSG